MSLTGQLEAEYIFNGTHLVQVSLNPTSVDALLEFKDKLNELVTRINNL